MGFSGGVPPPPPTPQSGGAPPPPSAGAPGDLLSAIRAGGALKPVSIAPSPAPQTQEAPDDIVGALTAALEARKAAMTGDDGGLRTIFWLCLLCAYFCF
jgi:hypothetical protein